MTLLRKSSKISSIVINSDLALTEYIKSNDDIPSNIKTFFNDLSSVLHQREYKFKSGIKQNNYFNLFLDLYLGGLQTLTNGSHFYTLKALTTFLNKVNKSGLQSLLNNLNEISSETLEEKEGLKTITTEIFQKAINETVQQLQKDKETEEKKSFIADEKSVDNPKTNKKIHDEILDKQNTYSLNSIAIKGMNMFVNTYNNLLNNCVSYDTLMDNSDLFEILSYEAIALKFPHQIDGFFFQKNIKIDIYLDISGSMGPTELVDSQSIAFQLWKHKLISKIYYFNTSLFNTVKTKGKKESISTAKFYEAVGVSSNGGTTFHPIYENIKMHRNTPSLIITDGQAGKIPYSKYITFLLINNENFRMDPQYYSNKQIIHYDNGKLTYLSLPALETT